MITGVLRSKIDRLWDAFWSGGISNPLEVIEQITYLMFIKRLDDLQTLKENKANRTGKPIENPVYAGTRRSHDASIAPKANARQGERRRAADRLPRRRMAGRHTMPAPGQTPRVKQATYGSCRDGPTAASAHRPLLANTNLLSIAPSGVRTPRTGRSGCSHTSWRDHRTHTPNRRCDCFSSGFASLRVPVGCDLA